MHLKYTWLQRERENLVKNIAPEKNEKVPPEIKEILQGKSAPSSSSRGEDVPHQSTRKVILADEGPKRLNLNSLEQNYTRRRKNARRVEQEIPMQKPIYYDLMGITKPVPPPKKEDIFDDGHVSSREEIQQELFALTGTWKLVTRAQWAERLVTKYLRGYVAELGHPYRTCLLYPSDAADE